MLLLGRDETAALLSNLGYQIDRGFKFKARPERTASAVINRDGTIHDFGTSAFHGDIIDFLKQFHSMTFADAKAYVEGRFGELTKLKKTEFEWKDERNSNPIPQKYLVKYLLARRQHKDAFRKELEMLFTGKVNGQNKPVCTLEKACEIAYRYQIGYVAESHRLIMPIKDENGRIMTFWKYRKNYDPAIDTDIEEKVHRKVLFSKNRIRPPFAITDLKRSKKKDLKIVLTEGEKDTLVCLANGLNAICVGGASAKIPVEYLSLFERTDVILAGDYDDAGQFFNYRVAAQLMGFKVKVTETEFKADRKALFEELFSGENKGVASRVTILDWEEKAAKDGFELFDKFDLADYFAHKFNKVAVR